MPGQHSKLGPSKADTWVPCTRSVSFIEENEDRLPPETSSVYADEGTRAHDIAQQVLTSTCDIVEIPPEFADLTLYLNEVIRARAAGGEVFIEAKVPLWYKPEDTGMVDFGVIREVDRRMHVYIIDLKWGQGIYVPAFENRQTAIYALSFIIWLEKEQGLYAFPPDTLIDICIVRPRWRDEEDRIDHWVVTLADLLEFTRHIDEAAQRIESGKQLQWGPTEKGCWQCPAQPICPNRYQNAEEAIPMPLEEITDDPIWDLVPDEKVLLLLQKTDEIRELLNKAWKYAEDRHQMGKPIPGTKLVQGRQGKRQWTDEQAAAKLLAKLKVPADQRVEKKVVSVATAEKLVKAAIKDNEKLSSQFASLITRPEGKPTLVLDTDRRPALEDKLNLLPDI